MDFLYVKALHIIFVVTWFAGLFYIVRLFMYHVEAEKKPEPAKEILQTQYKLMSKRLWYIITWPSAILASFFAFWMLYKNPVYLEMPWMHIKLTFVLALYVYHGLCHKIYKQLQNDVIKYTAFKLRIINEAPTIILFAVVFLVTLKSAINWIWGVVGIILFGVILMLGIRLYKKIREKRSWEKAEREVLESDDKKE
ncbi:CopD family protein [Polaribacter sp. R2A056_3_33]|jgi:putative membrane protein|uniref:CopD family protein n=1 Tax=unclassified Polaribacter TaxID=196858 RepID=UPI001C4E38CB|nr:MULTISPECIES: CopD family protein [unclassified Polaribacter]QXP64904.1 CopD family protein [Polaribacter sp. HaHaR_3_91]QXP69552.1 CopD family protein [Polaribacter sp. R2A056_3_33]